ncbi:MAG: site-specific integrase [Lachnospiraceae bacterium]|nr:site-specific integrase [Lachnospiraceae bacterium]
MDTLETIIKDYLAFCQYQKRLDTKTLKAYRTDLKQFKEFANTQINTKAIETFIYMLHLKCLALSISVPGILSSTVTDFCVLKIL